MQALQHHTQPRGHPRALPRGQPLRQQLGAGSRDPQHDSRYRDDADTLGHAATAAHGPNEVLTNGNRYDGSSEWKQQNADCAMSPVARESDASASPS